MLICNVIVTNWIYLTQNGEFYFIFGIGFKIIIESLWLILNLLSHYQKEFFSLTITHYGLNIILTNVCAVYISPYNLLW